MKQVLHATKYLLIAASILLASTVNAATLLQYNFDGDLTDSSGNGNDGTLALGAVTYTTGVDGQAAVFDGATAVQMPNDTFRGNQNFTLSLRFKTTSSDMAMLGYQNQVLDNSNGEYIPIVGISSDGKLRATLWNGTGAFSVYSPNAVHDDAWHRVDIVVNTTTGTLEAFIDGTSIGSQSATVDHLSMSYNYLGYTNSQSYFASNYYTGALDLLTLSDEAINPPAPSVQPVPALPLAGLIVLSMLLGITAMKAQRRRL